MLNIKSTLVTLILLTCIMVSNAHAEVYKHVDKDGYVTYSDKPVKGTTKPHIPEPINTIKKDNKPLHKRKSSNSNEDGDEEQPKATAKVPNYTLSISAPSDGEVIQANAGTITIQLAVAPPLSAGTNHQIVVKLDGQAKQSQSTAVTFTEVSRGPHTLTAEIIGESGQVLTQSSPVSIQVHRHSVAR